MRSPLVTGFLAAMAAATLIFAAAPSEAGDWRRHHHGRSGIVVAPGIVLQIAPRHYSPRHYAPRQYAPQYRSRHHLVPHFAPAPRYGHDRRAYSLRRHGWHDRRHGWDRGRHEGRHRGRDKHDRYR